MKSSQHFICEVNIYKCSINIYKSEINIYICSINIYKSEIMPIRSHIHIIMLLFMNACMHACCFGMATSQDLTLTASILLLQQWQVLFCTKHWDLDMAYVLRGHLSFALIFKDTIKILFIV